MKISAHQAREHLFSYSYVINPENQQPIVDKNGVIQIDESKLVSRIIIHPGKNDDGYWTNKDVVEQLSNQVIPIFDILHPTSKAVFSLITAAIMVVWPQMLSLQGI